MGRIETKGAIKRYIPRCATRQLCFGPASGQNGKECADARGATADQSSATGSTIGDSSSKSAKIGAAAAGHQHRGGVPPLTRRPLDFPFSVNAFLPVPVHAARGRPQVYRVAIRIGHLLERNTKLATALDAAWPFRFKNLATYEGTEGDGDFVVDGDRVGCLEIDRITRLGGPRVDAVAQQ